MRGAAALTFLTLVAGAAPGHAAEALQAWEITIETGMPHLEESLRYATVRERRCLARSGLLSVFPALRHESLRGCRLDRPVERGDEVFLELRCEGGNPTTGAARWTLGKAQHTGTLDLRMGGKNMTFWERVSARPAGDCDPGEAAGR